MLFVLTSHFAFEKQPARFETNYDKYTTILNFFSDNGAVLNVTGGCVEALRPASSIDCDPQCNAIGAICDQGKCRCGDEFEGED